MEKEAFQGECYLVRYPKGNFLVIRTEKPSKIGVIRYDEKTRCLIATLRSHRNTRIKNIRLPRGIHTAEGIGSLASIKKSNVIKEVCKPKGSIMSKVYHFYDDLEAIGLNPFNNYIVLKVKTCRGFKNRGGTVRSASYRYRRN